MINNNHEIGISLYLCMQNFSVVSTKCSTTKSIQDMIRDRLPSFKELRDFIKTDILLCPKKSIAIPKNEIEKYLQDCKKLERELQIARDACQYKHVRENLFILKTITARIIASLETLKQQLANKK